MVDIVIVSYNTLGLIQRCLQSIAVYTNIPYQVYVVDNGSTDGSLEFLRTQSWINLIEVGTNIGYGRACNIGAQRGQGEHIMFLNSDIEVTLNWLSPLVDCLDSHPKIAVVGPKLIDKNGVIKGAGIFGTNRRQINRGFDQPNSPDIYNLQEDCIAVCGAAFAIKRSLVAQLGLFDERYFFYFEEIDYCVNARDKGYRIVYCPHSVIFHHHAGSCQDAKYLRGVFENHKKIFEEKWHRLLQPKLTLMMLVKNEADRYLSRVLDEASEYVDEMVIIDDNSTDQTFEICSKYEKVKILERVVGGSYAEDERIPRIALYNLTLSTFPDWILAMDADEVFEESFKVKVRELIASEDLYWYTFMFYNFFYSERYYRIDGLWKPNFWGGGLRLYRHLPDYNYVWDDKTLHCGSIPKNILGHMPGAYTNFKIKHYGYAGNAEDIQAKHQRYITLDPQGIHCPRWHYDSIVSPDIILKEWVE